MRLSVAKYFACDGHDNVGAQENILRLIATRTVAGVSTRTSMLLGTVLNYSRVAIRKDKRAPESRNI